MNQCGLVVINRASHLCDPGSTLASGLMWAESQSISTWLRGFISGYACFPPSPKSTPSQLHLAGFAVLRDHTWIVWRQPWAPSHAFGPIPLSRLILKRPFVGSGQLSAHLHHTLIVLARGKQFCFPESPHVSRDEVETTSRVTSGLEGKQT